MAVGGEKQPSQLSVRLVMTKLKATSCDVQLEIWRSLAKEAEGSQIFSSCRSKHERKKEKGKNDKDDDEPQHDEPSRAHPLGGLGSSDADGPDHGGGGG